MQMRNSIQIGKQLNALRDLYIGSTATLICFQRELLQCLASSSMDEIEVPELQLILEDDLKDSQILEVLPETQNLTGDQSSD